MRYTVLTYIFDNYERVHEIAHKEDDVEYLLITDNPRLHSNTWTVCIDPTLDYLSTFDKCYRVRFHPFHYATTDTVVRIDGSIGIRGSLTPLVDAVIKGDYDRCLMIHPNRNNIEQEYDVWCRHRDYPLKQAAKCLLMMQHLGYDFNYRGLYQGGFEIVRKREVNMKLNDLTFDLLRYLGTDDKIERLDQTVFSFVANSLFSDRLKVLPVSEHIITDGNLMQWYAHNTTIPIVQKNNLIPAYLFDKPCQCWDKK